MARTFSVNVTAYKVAMKFHERFDLGIDVKGAQERFVNRVHNEIYEALLQKNFSHNDCLELTREMASGIGVRYNYSGASKVVGYGFLTNLKAVETLYNSLSSSGYRNDISRLIESFLAGSEFDLGIEWRAGKFFRKGAQLLDEKLLDNSLTWLRQAGPDYDGVLKPFQKGLGHLLESHIKKEHLADVVTDVYEALESLAKIVTGREKDLSGNQQAFVAAVKASEEYKQLLRDYIDYANNFRHAERLGKPKPTPTEREVESFVYLTGIFIRLAMP